MKDYAFRVRERKRISEEEKARKRGGELGKEESHALFHGKFQNSVSGFHFMQALKRKLPR